METNNVELFNEARYYYISCRDIITKDINIVDKYELKLKQPKKKSDNSFYIRDFLNYDGKEISTIGLAIPSPTDLNKALNMK
jgi:hypothetical protein